MPRLLAAAGFALALIGVALFVAAGLRAGPQLGLDELLRLNGPRAALAAIAAGTGMWVIAAIWYFRTRE